jgi:hypothetical protein
VNSIDRRPRARSADAVSHVSLDETVSWLTELTM